jgi:hypothetical protein
MDGADPLLELDATHRAAVLDHVSRLKHDLGKYVSLQVRWLEPGAELQERTEALRADLLSTRRGPSGEQDAVSLWEGFRPGLVGEADLAGGCRVDLTGNAELERIEAAMAVVRAVVAELRGGSVSVNSIDEGAAAARDVADACKVLHRRLREQGG